MGKQIKRTDFWDNPQEAGRISQEREEIKEALQLYEVLEQEKNDLEELLSIVDETEKQELEKSLKQLADKIKKIKKKNRLQEKYDQNDAFLTIRAGAGGTDAQDWAAMLLRMYLRWAERKGYRVKILEKQAGQEAGIKRATLEIKGQNVYGYLKSESGTHRLVRLSPFNTAHTRETGFAAVEVLPVLPENEKIEIKESDIRVDTFRSSGAGGQSVNTTDSAVRIIYLPKNIVVTCQNERSQRQNKETALKILQAKLYQLQEEEQRKKQKALRGENVTAEWGNQIRSYVLHPYKLVKDHRTGWESKNVEEVLNGELDDCMEKYLETYSK